MHETEVDAKTLSEFLRLHPRQVLKLAEQGLVVRMSRGKFALIESVANVVSHYRERLAGHTSADGKIDAMKSNAFTERSAASSCRAKVSAARWPAHFVAGH
jgi:phage terminase Nu1 subunit (DNA packaging protein)